MILHITRPPSIFLSYPHPGVYFFHVALFARIVLWYTYNVAALNLATERRDACVRYIYFVLNLYCGWYSLPLYLQMVRWRWVTATSLGLCTVKMQKGSPRYSQYRGLSLVLDTYFVLCLWQLYHMHFLFAIYSIYFFNVLRFKIVTVHSVRSNLVKMHSKSPSVMAFCPVCLGILPYSWQNTSRDITCEQLLKIHHFFRKFPEFQT